MTGPPDALHEVHDVRPDDDEFLPQIACRTLEVGAHVRAAVRIVEGNVAALTKNQETYKPRVCGTVSRVGGKNRVERIDPT